jgi:type II secretory pathway pseudopilin PulG
MTRPHPNAFTLVELLLASSITAVIIGGGLMAMSVVLHAYKLEGNKGNLAETAQLILDRMRGDLNTAFLSPHNDVTRFVGYDLQGPQFDADSLTFISAVNSPVLTGGGTSDLAEIQYFIDTDEETPERWLIRRIDVTPDEDPFTGGTNALLGPKVVSLNFQFFDGIEWYPSWNSTKGLPAAVNITIGLFQPKRHDELPTVETLHQFSTTVWIASRREITMEEAWITEEEEMEQGGVGDNQ